MRQASDATATSYPSSLPSSTSFGFFLSTLTLYASFWRRESKSNHDKPDGCTAEVVQVRKFAQLVRLAQQPLQRLECRMRPRSP